MQNYLTDDAWKIVETEFRAAQNEHAERCFSLGNGSIGFRACFEEQYSGPSLPGCFVTGIYHKELRPEQHVKNGFPSYSIHVINVPNWLGINVLVDGEVLDLATCKVRDFRRVLNMREGTLERSFTAKMVSGKEVSVRATRFCSIVEPSASAIRYAVKALNFDGSITFTPYLDGDASNSIGHHEEPVWVEVEKSVRKRSCSLVMETTSTQHRVCVGMKFTIFKKGEEVKLETTGRLEDSFTACATSLKCKAGDELTLYKYVGVVSSLEHDRNKLVSECKHVVKKSFGEGFDKMLQEHTAAWAARWDAADIQIEGDLTAQQAIRFCQFQLLQNFDGNVGHLPLSQSGFSGTGRFGGATWHQEVFLLPFFQSVFEPNFARNLLINRYNQLPKAIENAERLGITHGAALYPAATVNGEECHPEADISLETIHRNAAVAVAIFNYVRYAGDQNFLVEYGLEILVGIARFWAQRVHWSQRRQQYLLHGVTGPNEYERNINNNWYTNSMAAWCLEYALEALKAVENLNRERWMALLKKLDFQQNTETTHWADIAAKIYLPTDGELGIFVQQDGYLDKEQLTVVDLDTDSRPLNRHWSWDHILRSSFLQQADVLQVPFLLEDQFSWEELLHNFEFYEQRTVHETSISMAMHSLLAACLGIKDKALELLLRSASQDLKTNSNGGLHLASMAATWQAFVKGIGGMKVESDQLSFNPWLPIGWERYSFKVCWRGHVIELKVTADGASIVNQTGNQLKVKLNGQVFEL